MTFGPMPSAPTEQEDWGVPSTAVVMRDGRTVVLVVRAGIVAEAVVQAGSAVAGMAPVHGPLSQTDEVIVAPRLRACAQAARSQWFGVCHERRSHG
ncbi:MAG: hypothetical protein MRJ92_02755 [Nitrospira sp.]|nr:hypothetical protein [Nitrospira sp.]